MSILEGRQSSVNILIVEDDRLTRIMLISLFKTLGYTVMEAEDGVKGLELFKEHRHDLVLSDYNMPYMNGLEMFEHIKKESPATKLVMMTMYTESDVVIGAINLGVDRFLEKPVNRSSIEKVLDELVSDILNSKDLHHHQNLLKAYRLGVDASTIFSMLDTEGRYTYVNEQLCDICGYSEKELLGRHYSIIRKSEALSSVKYYEHKLRGDTRLWNGFLTNRNKNGTDYITEVNLIPIKYGKHVEGYISFEKDMSLLVSQHQSLLKSVFDADTSVMFAYDDNHFLKVFNNAFVDFFGFDYENRHPLEMMCTKGCRFSSGLELTAGDETFETYSAKEFFDVVDYLDTVRLSITAKESGKEQFFILNSFVLKQEYIGLDNLKVVRLHDITELEMLRNDEINRAMLASIGKLSAGITHEINTPLAYIKGNFELIEWDLEDRLDCDSFKEIEDYFISIKDGISRISHIIESMKEVTGEAKFEREECNLYSTLVYSARMVYNRAKHIANIYINGKPLTLDMDTSEENYVTNVAPRLLEQVWIILLNNGLDQLAQSDLTFEEKYIKINIDVVDGEFIITFSDNGGGIDPKIQNKLFGLFASTKKHKGMGLGLNIAKNIIDKHGGKIRTYNSDEGAIFEIVL